jgi:hypothetical protein
MGGRVRGGALCSAARGARGLPRSSKPEKRTTVRPLNLSANSATVIRERRRDCCAISRGAAHMKKTPQCNLHPASEMTPVVVPHRTATETNALPAWRCTRCDCVRHFEQLEGYFDTLADGRIERDPTGPHCTNDEAPMQLHRVKNHSYLYVCGTCGDTMDTRVSGPLESHASTSTCAPLRCEPTRSRKAMVPDNLTRRRRGKGPGSGSESRHRGSKN